MAAQIREEMLHNGKSNDLMPTQAVFVLGFILMVPNGTELFMLPQWRLRYGWEKC